MPDILKRRYLRPIKFGQRTKDFYVFDTETGKQERLKNGLLKTEYFLSARPEHLIFGVVYGPRGYVKVLHSAKEFIKEFKRKQYKNKIVYAHNAEYDLSSVYGNIYKLDPNAIFNGKFISCSNGVCRFADSFNLLPTSVKKLGALIGLSKKELGKNLVSKNFAQDVDYCIRDCEIVYKSLQKLFKDAEPSYTIGSLSLKIYRANFLRKGIKINELSDLFFSSLYGGRTEAFRIGEVNAQVVDLNSAYPDAMKRLRFPDSARLRIAENGSWLEVLQSNIKGEYYRYEGMIEATIEIPENIYIPMLPYRTKDKLMFPVGEFRGSWTLIEFRYAYFNFPVTVKKVHRLIIAESIETPFKEYIDFYYNLRKNTKDEFEKYYYKLFMNNLYGKLIQRAKEEFRFCETTKQAQEFMKQRKIKRVELIKVNGGYFIKYDIDKIFSHTIACWGAYITAYVRTKLHKQIMRNPRAVVYCDTDSIFVVDDWSDLNSKELGEWKKEDKTVTNIRALKDYVYYEDGEKKQMLKGVKKDAKQLDEHANVFKTKRMVKTRESFRRVDNLPPGTFIEQIKVMTGDYSKRKILKGGNTRPFKVNEFEK